MPSDSANAESLLYVIGGYNGTNVLNTVDIFDPTTNTWTSGTNMPTARSHLRAAVLNGKIYAIGGYNGTSYINTVEEYDPSTNTWTTQTSIPTAKAAPAVVTANGKIYIAGGFNGSWFKTVEEMTVAQQTVTGNKALLVITMTSGLEKEYELNATEINAFISWYDDRANGIGSKYYIINKNFNKGPFINRKDYLVFDRIQNWEVMDYN